MSKKRDYDFGHSAAIADRTVPSDLGTTVMLSNLIRDRLRTDREGSVSDLTGRVKRPFFPGGPFGALTSQYSAKNFFYVDKSDAFAVQHRESQESLGFSMTLLRRGR